MFFVDIHIFFDHEADNIEARTYDTLLYVCSYCRTRTMLLGMIMKKREKEEFLRTYQVHDDVKTAIISWRPHREDRC